MAVWNMSTTRAAKTAEVMAFPNLLGYKGHQGLHLVGFMTLGLTVLCGGTQGDTCIRGGDSNCSDDSVLVQWCGLKPRFLLL